MAKVKITKPSGPGSGIIPGVNLPGQKPETRWDRIKRTLLGGAGGALTGFFTGGPIGALIGAGVGGGTGYLSGLDPVTRNHALELAQFVEELQVKPKKTAEEKKQLQEILKSYPDLGIPGASKKIVEDSKGWLAEPNGNQWTGYAPQEVRFQKFSPEQQAGQSEILQSALSGLRKNPADFAPIEAQARQDFKTKTIPSIAERFSNLNAQRSSAFPQLLSQAGSDLETNLGALRAQHGLAQESSLQGRLGHGLAPQFESAFQPASPGILQGLAGQLGSTAIKGLGSKLFGQ